MIRLRFSVVYRDRADPSIPPLARAKKGKKKGHTSLTSSTSPSPNSCPLRVEHNAQRGAQSARREVRPKACVHSARVTVHARDFTPDSLELRVSLCSRVSRRVLSLVHKHDSLAEVEARITLVTDTLEAKDGLVVVLSSLASSQADEGSLNPESDRGSRLARLLLLLLLRLLGLLLLSFLSHFLLISLFADKVCT